MQICEKCERRGEQKNHFSGRGLIERGLIKSKDELFRSLGNKGKIFFFFYKGKLIEPNGSGGSE